MNDFTRVELITLSDILTDVMLILLDKEVNVNFNDRTLKEVLSLKNKIFKKLVDGDYKEA